jgi:quercetin dioxygenase-like cupin family protein
MNPHVAVARLEELPRIPSDSREDPAWTPIRHPLGVRAFGINAWHGDAVGDVIIEEHDEIPEPDCPAGHEELYFVAQGGARFTIDGEELDAPAGTLVAVPPNVRRAAHAAAAQTTILAIGAPRGEAFAPSAWERRAIEKAGLL